MTESELITYLREVQKPIKIMEVCGTHTSAIIKNGLRQLISPQIKLVSGPGCPVCVTPSGYIDALCGISAIRGNCVLSFGDLFKVTGSIKSLSQAKAEGGNVRLMYSPLEAIALARDNPDTIFTVAAAGFETTAPAFARMLEIAREKDLTNIKILSALKTMPPVLSFVCKHEETGGFICPGHVAAVTGFAPFADLAQKYRKPFVVAGFTPVHILSALYEIIRQTRRGEGRAENLYKNVVPGNPNKQAITLINQFFEPCDAVWRGIGMVQNSGLRLKKEYEDFNAGSYPSSMNENMGCRCSDVILGRINPDECPMFAKFCTPDTPMGACMVSLEGACGCWYTK